jgi:hypothetical protein
MLRDTNINQKTYAARVLAALAYQLTRSVFPMNRSSPTCSSSVRFMAIRTLCALAAAAMLGTTPLRAESPPSEDDPMHAARQLHGEYVELQNRINQIQQKTMEAHPELQQQEQAFLDLMMSKMDTSGDASAKEELAAIEDLEQKLRSEDTPDDQRKELMADYQKKAMAFRAAQMEALKDPEVREAQTALMDATLSAMKEEDPQTEQLMQQLEEKQQEMKDMMEAAGKEK